MRQYNVAAIAMATIIGFSVNHARGQEFIAHLTGFDEIGEIPSPYTGLSCPMARRRQASTSIGTPARSHTR